MAHHNASWHSSKKVRARADEWERQRFFIFYQSSQAVNDTLTDIL